VAVVLAVGGCNAKDAAAQKAAPRITDSAFESAASAVCRDTAQVFDVATTLPKIPTQTQAADLLVAIDGHFATMVAKLRQLTPAPADQAAVKTWLSDWDSYVAFGSKYADAVRAGAERDVVRNDSASQGDLRRRLQSFAVVNHMKACRFN
jgi:hypothetical protein